MNDDPRTYPSEVADDRASLTAFLDYQRATSAMKCAGLTGAQMRQRAIPTSTLILLGLVRHAVEVERSWFQTVLNGKSPPALWPRVNGAFGEWQVADADVDGAFTLWRATCEDSRAVVNAFPTLDARVEFRGESISPRYVLTHVLEEYARHNGHAGLLREAIDGAVGE
ncbi:DinB family protein [Streptomyces buecherae]|uniref:DinB family protein n=1 Tax=Streptomyces buecherae TaxID=2763006 RepID=UPI0037B395F3